MIGIARLLDKAVIFLLLSVLIFSTDDLFAPVIIIFTTEILRYVIIGSNKDKKYVIILTTLFLTLLELFITLKPINYTDFAGLFRIVN